MTGEQWEYLRKRNIIESDWGVLKQNYFLEYHQARSMVGLFRHYVCCISAYILECRLKSFPRIKTRIQGTYKNLKSAEAYIDNLIIYDYKADTISKIQYNIELNNGDLWTFRLSNCNLKNDDFYILIFLTIFDLSLDATNIRITSYNNMENIYFNEKELSEELIKQQDLFFLSNDQLRLLRNAFYAIHGYDFKSQDLKEYFSWFSWYKPNPNFSESDFTEIERKNIELIRQMENQEETIY